jgi:hypothetical protein
VSSVCSSSVTFLNCPALSRTLLDDVADDVVACKLTTERDFVGVVLGVGRVELLRVSMEYTTSPIYKDDELTWFSLIPSSYSYHHA